MYKAFKKNFSRVFFLLLPMLLLPDAMAWKIDFSRRTEALRSGERRMASQELGVRTQENNEKQQRHALDQLSLGQSIPIYAHIEPISLLLTADGFVPEKLRLIKGQAYEIHVVNVHPEKRNVSFMLRDFSQYHGIFRGDVKTFSIKPQKAGVYIFTAPEIPARGEVVVFDPEGGSNFGR